MYKETSKLEKKVNKREKKNRDVGIKATAAAEQRLLE